MHSEKSDSKRKTERHCRRQASACPASEKSEESDHSSLFYAIKTALSPKAVDFRQKHPLPDQLFRHAVGDAVRGGEGEQQVDAEFPPERAVLFCERGEPPVRIPVVEIEGDPAVHAGVVARRLHVVYEHLIVQRREPCGGNFRPVQNFSVRFVYDKERRLARVSQIGKVL